MGLQMLSNSNPVIVAKSLSKVYELYERPVDRLKQIVFGRPNLQYYREFHALSDVSFEVERGTSLGVIGRNGAGKSTLLQLITGTLSPSKGSVSIIGKVAAVLELGAGFNSEFSGRENIELYCNLLQMNPKKIQTKFNQIVEFSELSEFIEQPLKTYSSGMIARLAFSVIAHVDADIIIVDEALSVGDAAFSQKCMRFFKEFKKRGTIFFVSHDLSAVKAFCDKAIWLDGGCVRSYGEVRLVCEQYLAEIYPSASTQLNVSDESVSDSVDTESFTDETLSFKLLDDIISQDSTDSVSVMSDAQQIESFRFNETSSSFGEGGALVTSVLLHDKRGRNLGFCVAQQSVVLSIEVKTDKALQSPIVGFFIKDRLGQPLFGANTYLAYKRHSVAVAAGQYIQAHFIFRMPTLLVGDYSITAAIAEGTLEAHTQLHWAHDAAFFKVTDSSLDGVLVGIPMEKILLSASKKSVQKSYE